MGEYNFIEAPNIYPNLNDHQFKLKRTNEVKYYFIAEIKERELMSKRLSKYIASFDYFIKSSIALSTSSGGMSIASFVTVIAAPVGIASESFSFTFSIATGIIKNS